MIATVAATGDIESKSLHREGHLAPAVSKSKHINKTRKTFNVTNFWPSSMIMIEDQNSAWPILAVVAKNWNDFMLYNTSLKELLRV